MAHNASMYQKFKTFSEGVLVYLLAPHISSFQKGNKLRQYYVGIIVINKLLDPIH